MGKKRHHEDWPHMRQRRNGVPPLTAGPWGRVNEKGDDASSSAPVTIDGYYAGAEGYAPLGEITITRTRTRMDAKGRALLSRSFRATFCARGDNTHHEIGVGHCAYWEDAVEALSYMDIAKAIKAHGETIYGRPQDWRAMRPFKVVWPWDHPNEPNRQYSEFKLLGDWKLDEGREVIAYQYASTPTDARWLCNKVGANAYLAPHPDNALEWVIYHRGNMTAYDAINIDDFYARLIAGSGDDE